MPKTTIMIVDDHAMFRDGVAQLLAAGAGIAVEASVASAREAVLALKRVQPDVVLLDYDLGPGQPDGLEALKLLRRDHPDLPVVMVSMHAERHVILSAARAGASGYVLKSCPAEDLIRAVREVAAGRGWLSPDAVQELLRSIAANEAAAQRPADRYGLTERECAILQHVADGLTYRETGKALFTSESRVKSIMQDIFAKLEARGQAQATAIAVAEGIISPPRPSSL